MDIPSMLVGAAIALVSGLIGAVGQHVLSLRTDRIKRERDKTEKELAKLNMIKDTLGGERHAVPDYQELVAYWDHFEDLVEEEPEDQEEAAEELSEVFAGFFDQEEAAEQQPED